MIYIKTYESFHNEEVPSIKLLDSIENFKKIFIVGKLYRFNELPLQCQKDAMIQETEDYESGGFQDWMYKFSIVSPEKLKDYLNEVLEYEFDEYVYSTYINKLMKNINKNGLLYPPVGTEGNHRAAAFIRFNISMPCFEIITLDNEEHPYYE